MEKIDGVWEIPCLHGENGNPCSARLRVEMFPEQGVATVCTGPYAPELVVSLADLRAALEEGP